MRNWIVYNRGGIYATFMNTKGPVMVGKVIPGYKEYPPKEYIIFFYPQLSYFKSKVIDFIKEHKRKLGYEKQIIVEAPFSISVNDFRKISGGKKHGKWIYQYKPASNKLANVQSEIRFMKQSKAKLDKYISRIENSINSLQKIRKGLIKIKNGL